MSYQDLMRTEEDKELKREEAKFKIRNRILFWTFLGLYFYGTCVLIDFVVNYWGL